MRNAQTSRERRGIVRQFQFAIGGILLEINGRVRSHEFAHIGNEFDEFALGLAPSDDERAWDFKLVVGMERRSDARIGFDDVRARLLSGAAAAGHFEFEKKKKKKSMI